MTTEIEVQWQPTDMVEVSLSEPDDFLKVRETLTRIGVASRKERKLYQYEKRKILIWKALRLLHLVVI